MRARRSGGKSAVREESNFLAGAALSSPDDNTSFGQQHCSSSVANIRSHFNARCLRMADKSPIERRASVVSAFIWVLETNPRAGPSRELRNVQLRGDTCVRHCFVFYFREKEKRLVVKNLREGIVSSFFGSVQKTTLCF